MSGKRYSLLFLSLIFPHFVFLSTHAEVGDHSTRSTLVTALDGELAELDPAQAFRQSDLQIISLVFQPIYRVRDGLPVPWLVTDDVQVSSDARLWRLTLRDGITMHDGTAMTAKDVVDSLQAVLKGRNRFLLKHLVGMSVESDSTFTLRFRRPTVDLRWTLAMPTMGICVRRKRGLVGSGPYQLGRCGVVDSSATVRRTRYCRLVAHDRYAFDPPALKMIEFRSFSHATSEASAFQGGLTSVSLSHVELFPAEGRRDVSSPVSDTETLLAFAISNRVDRRAARQLRRAIRSGVDLSRLAQVTGYAKPAHFALNPPLTQLTLAEREQLIAQKERQSGSPGVADGEAPEPHVLSLLLDESRLTEGFVAEQLIAALDRRGVSIRLEAVSAEQYQRRVTIGDFDLALVHHSSQVPHAPIALASLVALAGRVEDAERCIIRDRCDETLERAFSGALALIPLMHLEWRANHDPNLMLLPASDGGLVPYEQAYWRPNPDETEN